MSLVKKKQNVIYLVGLRETRFVERHACIDTGEALKIRGKKFQ